MNVVLISLFLVSLLGELVGSAPAVSSVHVSFVSGNKKTQYSHGTHARPVLVQYNLEAAGSDDEGQHSLQRRSISKLPPPEQASSGGAIAGNVPRERKRLRGGQPHTKSFTVSTSPPHTTSASLHLPNRINNPSATSTIPTRVSTTNSGRTRWTTTSRTSLKFKGQPPHPLTFRTTTTSGYGTLKTPTKSHKKTHRISTASTSSVSKSAAVTIPASGKMSPFRRQRSRVRVVSSVDDTSSAASSTGPSMTTATSITSIPSTDTDTTEIRKPKDSKAVKRSPYVENFESRGITFPDFDEFGGNDFGALKNFIGHGGGLGPVASDSRANPESLSPDGVFLPPLPTEASDYSDDGQEGHHSDGGHHHHDPYLSDKETAKYAAQHPPFFAAFPHKRTVLDLNERRVDQGLEPNILRSIRPFFAFFDSANPHHQRYAPYHHSSPALSGHPNDHDYYDHTHNHLLLHPKSFVVAEEQGGVPPTHHLLSLTGHSQISTPTSNPTGHHALIVTHNNHPAASSSPLLDEDDPSLILLAQSLLSGSGSSSFHYVE